MTEATKKKVIKNLRQNAGAVWAITYLGYALLYSTRKPFSVVKMNMQQELNLTLFDLGAIDTAFLGAYAFSQFFAPAFIQKYKLSIVLVVSYLGSALSTLGFSFSESVYPLCFMWFLNGAFQAPVLPLMANTVSSKFSSEKRGQILGFWTTSQQIGSLVATAFASYISASYHYKAAFLIPAGVVGVYGCVMSFFVGRYLTPDEKQLHIDDDQKSEIELTNVGIDKNSNGKDTNGMNQEIEAKQTMASFSSVLGIPRLINVACSYFFIKFIRYSLLFWLPYFLRDSLGYSNSVAGYSSMAFDIGGIFGAIFTGQLADRVLGGRRFAASCVMIIVSICCLWNFTLFCSQGSVPAIAAMVIVGFSIAGPDSVLGAAAVQDLCEDTRAGKGALLLAAGIVNGMGSAGAVVQGYVTALISHLLGWSCLFSVLSGLACLSLILLIPTVLERKTIH